MVPLGAFGPGTYDISTCWSSIDTLLAIYTVDGAALTNVAANDDAPQPSEGGTECYPLRGADCPADDEGESPPDTAGCRYRGSRTSLTVAAGSEYLIAVDGKDGEGGGFELTMSGPPSNDSFAGARSFSSYAYGSTSRAQAEAGEPAHAGTAAAQSVWYRYDVAASAPSQLRLTTCGYATAATRIAVYTGTGMADLQEVTSAGPSDDCAQGRGAQVSWRRAGPPAAATYWIAVDGADADFGLAAESGPANDERADAAVFGQFTSSLSGTTQSATLEEGEPDHAGAGLTSGSVWYRWQADRTVHASFDTCGFFGFGGDTVLAVYRLVGDGLVPVASNDDMPGCGGSSQALFAATSGEIYFVAVQTRGADTSFTLDRSTGPSNDNRADALQIYQSLTTGTNVLASKEPGETDHAGTPGGASVWFRYASSETRPQRFDTCAGYLDTLLAVYTVDAGGVAQPVVSSDDVAGCGPDGLGSRVSFTALAGTTYYLAVDGKDGATGSFQLSSPPANDDFIYAFAATADSVSYSGQIGSAGAEAGEPDHGGSPAARSVWHNWTPQRSTAAVVSSCGYYESALEIYTGNAVDALTPVATAPAGACPAGQQGSRITFQTTANTTYRVAVDAGGEGIYAYYSLSLRLTPTNDDLANAPWLGAGGDTVFSGSNVGATREPGEPDHASAGGGASVWYRWTPSRAATARVDTCSYASFDTALAVYKQPAGGSGVGSLVLVAGNDDASGCGSSPGRSKASFSAAAGDTYFIAVDGHGAATGDFYLSAALAPANDDIADAAVVTPGSSISGSSVGATVTPGEPNHGGSGGASVWYQFTAPRTGSLLIGTCGTYFDTLLAVYGGTPGSLSQLASNDDTSHCGSQTTASRVTVNVVRDTVYYVAVDGNNGASGYITLTVDVAANDNFADARQLIGRPASVAGTTVGASRETNEPTHSSVWGSYTVWYRWTAPDTRDVTFSTCGSNQYSAVAVYTGTALTNLVRRGSDRGACDQDGRVTLPVTAGTQYYVAIDARPGAFQLLIDPPANDRFASATELASLTPTATGSIAGAGFESGETAHAPGEQMIRSVWYRWTALRSAPTTAETCTSDVPTSVQAFAYGMYWPVTLRDDATPCPAGSHGQSIRFDAYAGFTYYFAVAGASDAVGEFTVNVTPQGDTTPPTTYLSALAARSNQTAQYAYFSASEPSTFACSLDDAAFTACTSPLHLTGLTDASHTLQVRATDIAGNVEPTPASSTFVVDLTAPDTQIDSSPSAVTRTATFTFSSAAADRAYFLCSVDGGGLYFCYSPYTIGSLSTGSHNLSVAAMDTSGNIDATPATVTFVIDRTPPAVQITDPGTDGDVVDGSTATVSFEAESGASTACSIDGNSYATCTSPKTYTGLLSGSHTIAVRATDGPGNTAVAARQFTIDLTPADPPANDGFAQAIALTSAAPTATGSTRHATAEAGEPAHHRPAKYSVWFSYTPALSREVTITSCGSSFDTVLAVYTGSTAGALSRVTSDDDGDCEPGSVARFDAQAGQTYRVALDSYANNRGAYRVALDTPPANDARRAARLLDGSAPVTGSTVRATAEAGEPSRAGHTAGRSVWFKVQPPASGRVLVHACGSPLDTVMAAYELAADGSLSELDVNDDAPAICGAGSATSAVRFPGVGGHTYFVALDDGTEHGGEYQVAALLNDDRAAARPVSSGPATRAHNVGATVEVGEPSHAGQAADGSVWFAPPTTRAGTAVMLDTCDSPLGAVDTVLAVYEVAGPTLRELGSNDDAAACGPGGHGSRVAVVSTGLPLLAVVDGKAGARGAFSLSMSAPPLNDARADAMTIAPDATSVSGTTVDATRESGEPVHAGVAGSHSVWYRWTPSADTIIELDLCGVGFSSLLAVYDAGTLAEVAADAALPDEDVTGTAGDSESLYLQPTGCGHASGGRTALPAVAGTTYLIAIAGRASAAGTFTLKLHRPPSNDDFADAAVLDASRPHAEVPLHLATREAGEYAFNYRSAWYRYSAVEERTVTIRACDEAWLSVFTGSEVDALTLIAEVYAPCDQPLSFDARPGVTYYVAVDGPRRVVSLDLDAPENDAVATPRTLGGTSTAGSTALATRESGEQLHAGEPGGRSVWFRVPGRTTWPGAPAPSTVVSACDSDFATLLAAYDEPTETELAASSDTEGCGDGHRSVLRFTQQSGRATLVALDGREGAGGPYRLGLLSNDDRGGATVLAANTRTPASNRFASAEPGELANAGQAPAHTVWYALPTLPAGRLTTVETCATAAAGIDTILAAYTGTTTLTRIAQNDDTAGCGTSGTSSQISFVAPAVPVFVAVDGKAAATGSFVIESSSRPPNDDRAAARAITDDIDGTLRVASAEPGEPAHASGRPAVRSVWYSWTAASNASASFDVCDAPFDSVLAVYTAGGGLHQVASSDDAAGCGRGSRVAFGASAGTTYYVAVDSPDSDAGAFTLRLDTAPDNDAWANAAPLATVTAFGLPASGSLHAASAEPGEPAHAGLSASHSLWYRVDAPAYSPAALTVDTCALATKPTRLAVYEGTSVNALTLVTSSTTAPGASCAAGNGSIATWRPGSAPVDRSYWVAIDAVVDPELSFAIRAGVAPPNDERAGAQALAFAPPSGPSDAGRYAYGSGVLLGTTHEPGEPDHAGAGGSASLWYRVTPDNSRPVRLSSCTVDYPPEYGLLPVVDTAVAVYRETAGGGLTEVASAHGGCLAGARGTRVRLTVSAGEEYLIAVDAPDGRPGRFDLAFRTSAANDNRADAQPVVATYASGDTIAATKEPGEPDHVGDAGGRSVWYRWTAPLSKPYRIDTCGSGLDSLLAVYTDDGGTLGEVAANDDAPDCGTPGASAVEFDAVAGRSYLVAVDAKAAAEGSFLLTFSPANDALQGATELQDGVTVQVDLARYTAEPGEPSHGGSPADHSGWYTLTPTRSGLVTIDACGAAAARLAAYAGTTFSSLVALQPEPGSSCASGAGARLRFQASAGKSYRIAVDSVPGKTLRTVQVTRRDAPPADRFADRQDLGFTSSTGVAFDTTYASREIGEPDHAGAAGTASVWYRWQPPYSATAHFDTCGAGFPTAIAVYVQGGTGVEGLAPVADSDGLNCGAAGDGVRAAFHADSATVYYIAVDGADGARGAGTLTLEHGPSNDDLNRASGIGEWAVTSSTALAGREAGEAQHSSTPGGHSTWYRWTAPHAANVRIDTCTDAAFDSALAVYRQTGSGHAGLLLAATSDGDPGCGSGNRGQLVRFRTVAGASYYIAVDGRSGAMGEFTLTLVHGPANDDLTTAQPVGETLAVSGDTGEATHQIDEPDHASAGTTASAWYRWVAPYDAAATIDTCGGGSLDTVLAVYTVASSALADLQLVAANDDSAGCASGGLSKVQFDAESGKAYHFAVDGKSGSSGSFTARVRIAPRNDNISAAPPAALGTTTTINTAGATLEPAEPSHGAQGGASVWYRFTANRIGPIAITTCASSFDTILAVYSGTPGQLTQLAANDDDPRCGGATSRVVIDAVADRQYYVAVDGKSGVTGTARLTIDPPGNDDFDDAPMLSGRPLAVTGSTVAATRQSADPGAVAGNTVWYRWRAPESRTITVSTCGNDVSAGLAVYTGATLASLQSVSSTYSSCASGNELTLNVVANTLYSIVVATTTPGGLQLQIDRPVNDDVTHPTALASEADVTVSGDNRGAGRQAGEPAHGAVAAAHSIWFAWTAPGSANATADTCDSILPVAVRVYRNGFGNPLMQAPVACPDGSVGTATRFVATGGTTYLIAVDSTTATTGMFQLHVVENLDHTPPVTTITDGPTKPTRADSVQISFSADELATFACSLDGATAQACTSPHTVSSLTEGDHTLTVVAIDPAGNAESPGAQAQFTIDRTPPETTVTGGPTGPIHDELPAYDISGSELLSAIECQIDEGSYGGCGSLAPASLAVGEHTVRIRAIDRAGNIDPTPALRVFTIVNVMPTGTANATPATGAAPLEVAVAVTGADADDDLLRYRVDYGDGTTDSTGVLPDSTISHTYQHAGTYSMLVTVSDPWASKTFSTIVVVSPGDPLDARAGDDLVVSAGTTVRFDGSNSRPLAGIEQYHWSFGDGQFASSAKAAHTYQDPGTYAARLTTTRAGLSRSDEVSVTVKAPTPTGLTITAQSGGAPVSGADVLVMEAGGSRVSSVTNGSGTARLNGLSDGTYTVYVDKRDYQPERATVTVAGGSGSALVDLESGAVAVASLDSRPLTYDEIIARGIDPNAPGNQHSVDFQANIALGDSVPAIPLQGALGPDGFYGATFGGTSCTRASCSVRYGWGDVSIGWHWTDDDGTSRPSITVLVIPFRASWLKEFFDVSFTIANLAPAGYTLAGGHVTLSQPSGLSLAPTAATQSPTMAMPDVPGGASRTVSWTLRGDVEGEYDLEADYAGRLEPVGRPVAIQARTRTPLKVWGGSALKFIVETDDVARDGHPFNVRVGMRNVADVPVYNAAIELLEDGRVGYVEQPRQGRAFRTHEISPGETFWSGDFILVPKHSGTVLLEHSFVRKVAGDVSLDAQIITRPRVPPLADTPKLEAEALDGSIKLDWDPIPGASGYEAYAVADRDTPFGDDPSPVELDGTAGLVEPLAPGEHRYYAVSAIINGRHTMVHPLVEAPPPPPPGEGKEDPFGPPKGECGLTSVKLGPAELLASCFTKNGDVYTATGRVRVNGIDLLPQGARVTVDLAKAKITVDEAKVKLGTTTLYVGRIEWSPSVKKTFSLPGGTMIGHLPVRGSITISLQPDRADLEGQVELPGMAGLGGTLKLGATNKDGPKLDVFEITATGLSVGRLGIDELSLKYKRTSGGDRWEGGAGLLIPRPVSPMKLRGSVALLNGKFKGASLEADRINQHIAYGVFLQRLRGALEIDPLAVEGTVGISAGPDVLGKTLVGMEGTVKATFGNPQQYSLSGELTIADVPVRSGYIRYRTDGLLELGGSMGFEKGKFKAKAGVDGWIDGTRAANVKGYGEFSVPGVSFSAEGVVSSVGIAACRHGSGPDVGAGYRWGDDDVHIFASGCDVGPYEATRAALDRSGASGFTVAPDSPLEVLAFHGDGGAPRVVLEGPDGRRVEAPDGGRGIDEPDVMLVQYPDHRTTYVAIFGPAAGEWTVGTAPASVAVTSIQRAGALPEPAVAAEVQRSGADAILRWQLHPIAGQEVQLVERSANGARVITETNEASGSAVFTPLSDDDAGRTIQAVVTQNGMPRRVITVERFVAPPSSVTVPPAAGATAPPAGSGPTGSGTPGSARPGPAPGPPHGCRARRGRPGSG